MQRLNTLWLETLCCIARLGTYQAAAEHLNTTQPAISARIKELEDAVGVPLFAKQGRRMVLTVQGRELVQRSTPLLQGLGDLLISLGNLQAASGVVRLGIGEIIALSWMPALVQALARIMPRLSYEISVGMTVDMQRELEDGKIDIAMGATTSTYRDMPSASLGSVDMLWVMSPRMPTPPNTASTPMLRHLLQHCPVWSLSKSSSIHHLTVCAYRALGIRTRRLHVYGCLEGIIKLVLDGSGIALLPGTLVRHHLAQGGMIAIPAEPAPDALEFSIAWNDAHAQVIVQKIVETALAVSTFTRRAGG